MQGACCCGRSTHRSGLSRGPSSCRFTTLLPSGSWLCMTCAGKGTAGRATGGSRGAAQQASVNRRSRWRTAEQRRQERQNPAHRNLGNCPAPSTHPPALCRAAPRPSGAGSGHTKARPAPARACPRTVSRRNSRQLGKGCSEEPRHELPVGWPFPPPCHQAAHLAVGALGEGIHERCAHAARPAPAVDGAGIRRLFIAAAGRSSSTAAGRHGVRSACAALQQEGTGSRSTAGGQHGSIAAIPAWQPGWRRQRRRRRRRRQEAQAYRRVLRANALICSPVVVACGFWSQWRPQWRAPKLSRAGVSCGALRLIAICPDGLAHADAALLGKPWPACRHVTMGQGQTPSAPLHTTFSTCTPS